MDTLLITPSQFLLDDGAVAESTIREIFFRHWEKMKDEFLAAGNQINIWRQTMINDTNKYADELLHALANDFNRFKSSCQQQCDENLAKAYAYHEIQNVELYNELCESCRSLKFQLARLESATGELHSYRIVTIEEQIEKERIANSCVNESQTKSETKHISNSEIHQYIDHDSSLSTLSSNSNRPETESILMESSKQCVSIDIASNNESNSNDDEKCPTCYMIFTKDMTIDKRSEHVQEHYFND
ncbi:unnamed protein product [Adineta ricciae]|uniref:UBZ1-type domain-containing protein n=1 Tax=Adineta ricciae TaxID=249248 RepID=A0A814GFF2_ADIRI|nr:unnamed protein product [Adineta ricciae]CAF1000258.1 unnamed protein product [Adineta ricciae]